MTSTIGIASITNVSNGEVIALEAGFPAAVRVHAHTGKDILVWVEDNARSRIGLCEIFLTLQKDTNFTQEEIWEKFFSDPTFFEKEDYMPNILKALAICCGAKYQEQVVEEIQAAEKEARAKKVPAQKK